MLFEQFKNLFATRKLLFQASDHPNLIVNAVYSGFDPTKSSLHIGNIVPILGLILCGKNGIKPYYLIGSATALIGDPTGRQQAKETLTLSDISSNGSSISNQIENIYYRGIEMLKCDQYQRLSSVDNLSWFNDMKIIDFLSKIGRQVKVNAMLSRNCVQSRLNSEDSLSFCELSYQLMQGYDYFHLYQKFGVNVQIGGSDQWGNMISGTEFIGKSLQKDAAFITVPLLTTANGVKMGKSAGNAIWLDSNLTSVYDFYQSFLSLSDKDAFHILPLLSIYNHEIAYDITCKHLSNPEAHLIQKYIAKHVTQLIHGLELANQVETFSESLFSRDFVPTELVFDYQALLGNSRFIKLFKSTLPTKNITVLELLKNIFPEYSNSKLKTMITSGGLKFNHIKISDLKQIIRLEELSEILLLNYGKTSFYVIKMEN